MRIARQLQHEDPETISFAPFLNLLVVALLLFLTTAAYEALDRELPVNLPASAHGEESHRNQGEIVITIRDDGAVLVGKRQMDRTQLQEMLQRVGELFPNGGVVIRGDQSAKLGRAVEILDVCRSAGVADVSFAAVPPEGAEVAP